MISIRNIIINNEIKKSNIIRKDYATRTVEEFDKEIKKNNYSCITYKEFKQKEKKIINSVNNNLAINDEEELNIYK